MYNKGCSCRTLWTVPCVYSTCFRTYILVCHLMLAWYRFVCQGLQILFRAKISLLAEYGEILKCRLSCGYFLTWIKRCLCVEKMLCFCLFFFNRNYMNDSLRTNVFVRFQPETIACACISLAARALQVMKMLSSTIITWKLVCAFGCFHTKCCPSDSYHDESCCVYQDTAAIQTLLVSAVWSHWRGNQRHLHHNT